ALHEVYQPLNTWRAYGGFTQRIPLDGYPSDCQCPLASLHRSCLCPGDDHRPHHRWMCNPGNMGTTRPLSHQEEQWTREAHGQEHTGRTISIGREAMEKRRVYPVGYSHYGSEQALERLMSDPNIRLIDTRYQPYSWRPTWRSDALRAKYGGQYR